MAEVDYQMALLLQYKLDQENLHQSQNFYTSDSQLAKSLQEQFEKESEVEEPGQNLVYKRNKSRDTTKSLTDPSWEVIDPTPDIHILFMAFNKRFFYNKLLAVCVSWSKRMTSCAGICSYQGRGGMCSITLSEPLLKLRPRKDLVETLLHEMIHAYLFVTHNNRDRDGHGPEFHKHMYRINGEAGTNITVYHDFHDEVRLYKQHWWRCNGPCQKWKPYFGMVRRAINRAPGPSDRWWGEHSRTCGGSFLKVKEPENLKKSVKSIKQLPNKDATDIRKFISTSNGTNSKSNIHGITKSKSSNTKIGPTVSTNSSNIEGFTNLNRTTSDRSSAGGNKSILRNNSNTVVINKKPSTVTKNGSNSTKQGINSHSNIRSLSDVSNNVSKAGVKGQPNVDLSSLSSISTCTNNVVIRQIGNILGNFDNKKDNNESLNGISDYSVVRNHWLNKFSNNDSKVCLKRKSPEVLKSPRKISRIFADSISNSLIECPVCNKNIAAADLNDHLDNCLEENHTKECVICGKELPVSCYENHVIECTDENFGNDIFEIESDSVYCKNCKETIDNNIYASHYKNCRSVSYASNMDQNVEKQCGICEKYISGSEYDVHMEKCLLKIYEEMEASYKNNDEMVNCLACSQKICKSELNSHLEDCMSMSMIFDDDNEPVEKASKEEKYNCPFCMKLILETSMNSHISNCMDIDECTSQPEKNE